jgi:twinkle protein
MAILAEKLFEQGIRARRYVNGDQKLTCPRCSHMRRDRTDPCLSLTIDGDGAVWKCHHCGWTGSVKQGNDAPPRRRQRTAPARPQHGPAEPTPAVLAWLDRRGISEAVARRNGVGFARYYIPKLGAEVDCIAFPYRRTGELVNVKYRALVKKAFAQVKGAEAILYGLDDLVDAEDVILVEGELDKLACEQAGYLNAASVPNGAQGDGTAEEDSLAFAYLANCADELDRAKRIILALDNDEKGRTLESELARRLGRERCWRVRWPDSEDAPCKDANEVLLRHGPEVLRECIEAAEPYPIAGLRDIFEYAEDTIALYRDGRSRGLLTGWSSVDELMTVRPGEVTVVTGIPNHGKSEFVDALAVNLAQRYDWVFAVCSFENPPPEHIAKLAEKYLRLPFWDGPARRMSESELQRAIEWVREHFVLIRADYEAPTIDWILGVGRAAIMRRGVRGLVVDPYNEVEHQRPPGMTETEYISALLGKLRRFAQLHSVHVWIVAHPKVLQRESGKIPVPTLYDISGSAHWANKPDLGIVVHRPDPVGEPRRADIYVRKVRFKSVGKIGVVSLQHDPTTGQYSELRPRSDAPRVCRD